MDADVRPMSDAALVVAIGRGSKTALNETFRRHAGPVFSLARRVTANQHLAEEVVQDVFVKLWDEPERFDAARGALRSYLVAIAHRRAVDAVRSESARTRREDRAGSSPQVGGQDIEREVWNLAVSQQVKEALDRLSVEERQPIEMAYFGGMTYRQVASALGYPEGTVKSRIRSGLRRLRSSMTEAGMGSAWH